METTENCFEDIHMDANSETEQIVVKLREKRGRRNVGRAIWSTGQYIRNSINFGER